MISLQSKIGYVRAICRIASLLACGVSLLIVYHVQPIAAKTYNDLCASQGMTFGDGKSAHELGITMIVIAVPILFARSNALVFINLCASLITVLGATSLLRFYLPPETRHTSASRLWEYTKIVRPGSMDSIFGLSRSASS